MAPGNNSVSRNSKVTKVVVVVTDGEMVATIPVGQSGSRLDESLVISFPEGDSGGVYKLGPFANRKTSILS